MYEDLPQTSVQAFGSLGEWSRPWASVARDRPLGLPYESAAFSLSVPDRGSMPLSCRVARLWQSQQLEGQRFHLFVPTPPLALAYPLQFLVEHDGLGTAHSCAPRVPSDLFGVIEHREGQPQLVYPQGGFVLAVGSQSGDDRQALVLIG